MKGIIVITIAAVLIFIAGILVMGQNSGGESREVIADIPGIEVDPEMFDMGEVPINGGEVIKEYKIKNTSGSAMKLKKIATSCMCTEAKIKIGDKETKMFGMEGHGDRNPPINLEFPAGSEAIVTAVFDPNAHGPQGVGPFDRVVWLTFSDPGGIKELKFKGTVVN